MIRRPRTEQPLPAATAVVLAVLVALSATITHGLGDRLGSVGSGPSTRIPSPLATPGRVLASALASVAERLEDDWTLTARRGKLTGARTFEHGCSDFDGVAHGAAVVVITPRACCQDGDGRQLQPCVRDRLIRLATNLPPPLQA